MRCALLAFVAMVLAAAPAGVWAWAGPADIPAEVPDRPVDPAKVANRTVLVVPIQGEIGTTTVHFVKRSIRLARRERVAVVLFEFDTPGGAMDKMFELCQELGRIDDLPTIGFVNPMAGSAGAIILAGVNRIYMSEAGVVGAAALVAIGPEGIVEIPPRELEKYNSFVRAQVKTLAEKNGHPYALFQAMVDQEIEVREVTVDGQRRILTADEIGNLQVELQRGQVQQVEVGKVLVPRGTLLTLTSREAEEWGLSRGTVTDRTALLRRIGLEDFAVVVSSETWSEHVARFLTHPMVVLLLIVVGAIGIYVELNTPGFGVPGIVGISAFAVLFFGQYVAGLAGVLEPILFLVGVTLLALEIFVIPGFGVAGISGILCILLGIILAGQDFVLPDTPFQAEVFLRNVAVVFGGLLVAVVGMIILARHVPRTRVFERLVLRGPVGAGDLHASAAPTPAEVGERGEAVTALRPAGKARFAGRLIDVVAEGQFIDPRAPVEVLRVEGNRVVVRVRSAKGEAP